MTNTDDIPEALAILEGAYLVRHNEELNKRVNDALDLISAKGDIGIKVLLEWLYRDMRLVGSNLQVMFGGDEAWNEWLKKRAIVEALGRARAKSAVPQLVPLVSAQCRVPQFSEILRPAVVRALGEIGDKRALEPLHNALHSDQVNQATKKAIGEALEKIEGHAPRDPALIIAQADSLYKSGKSKEVLQTLEQINSRMFDTLSNQDKYYLWFMLGEAYRTTGDTKKAAECYRASLKYFSDPSAIAYDRLRELGQYTKEI